MSEEIVGGVASTNLRKGRLIGLTAFGIFTTPYKLIITRTRTPIIALLYLDTAIALVLEIASFLLGATSPASGILFLLGLVPSFLALVGAILLPKFVDQRVQRRSPRSFWDIEPRDKELELSKGEIDSIELKIPTTWSRGHVKIGMKSGQVFKLGLYKHASGGASIALAVRISGLLETFAAKPPSARTLETTRWTL